jgi:hypothetical protein
MTMIKRSIPALVAVAAGAALLAGCDGLATSPLISNPNLSPGPTISGSVKGVTATNLRVGLLGAKGAGQSKVEVASSSVAGSNFTLQLPREPGLDKMANDTESLLFTLQAYEDKNSNGRFDSGDTETDAVAASGTFRFFAEDSPNRTAGWYQFKNGQYTKSFDVAFDLNAGG